MAANPSFTSTPRYAQGTVSTANTNRDGTGTIVSIITGVSAGTKIFEIITQATGTTTAGMVRLFVSTDSGSTWKLFDEVSIAAATPSATVKGNRVSTTYANLILPSSSHQLGASTHNAESIQVIVLGGDLT